MTTVDVEPEVHESPLVSFHLWSDGSTGFEFMLESGEVHAYRFDDPEYVLGVSEMFHKAAHMSNRVRSGEDFETVAPECGGVWDDPEAPMTLEEFDL